MVHAQTDRVLLADNVEHALQVARIGVCGRHHGVDRHVKVVAHPLDVLASFSNDDTHNGVVPDELHANRLRVLHVTQYEKVNDGLRRDPVVDEGVDGIDDLQNIVGNSADVHTATREPGDQLLFGTGSDLHPMEARQLLTHDTGSFDETGNCLEGNKVAKRDEVVTLV